VALLGTKGRWPVESVADKEQSLGVRWLALHRIRKIGFNMASGDIGQMQVEL
jgi:hypothetical protein